MTGVCFTLIMDCLKYAEGSRKERISQQKRRTHWIFPWTMKLKIEIYMGKNMGHSIFDGGIYDQRAYP